MARSESNIDVERRRRAGALIIREGRLLLVHGNHNLNYWTPGGGLEENETHEEALRRELDEELSVRVRSCFFYKKIVSDGRIFKGMQIRPAEGYYYLVEIDGDVNTKNEVAGTAWLDRQELTEASIIDFAIIEELLKDNLV